MSKLYNLVLLSVKLRRTPFESTGITGFRWLNFSPSMVGLIRQNTRMFPETSKEVRALLFISPKHFTLIPLIDGKIKILFLFLNSGF